MVARRFEGMHTQSWSDYAHFLLVTTEGDTMRVRPIGELIEKRYRTPALHTCRHAAQREILIVR